MKMFLTLNKGDLTLTYREIDEDKFEATIKCVAKNDPFEYEMILKRSIAIKGINAFITVGFKVV